MRSIVRGLIHQVTRSKYITPESFSRKTNHRDKMAFEGTEELEDSMKAGNDTSITASMDQFHLLLQVLQSNGKPLMNGNFTGRAIAEVVQKYTGKNPIEVEVRNEQDAIVQFDNGVSVGEAARLLHGTHDWLGQVVRISCLLSTRESIEGVVDDREKGRSRLAELEKDQQRVQQEQERVRVEQAAHAAHLERVLAQFGHEVQKVEELQRNAMAAASAHLMSAPPSAVSVTGSHSSTKINKPPALPNFSGSDPVPKDEGSYEQWKFQVTGALKVCTEEAVRSAIVRSVRGEVREMISFLGFDGDLSDILEKVEKRFGKQLSGDRLQQEFYQLSQEKSEKIRQFAGRLEQKFKYLKEKFPDRYQTTDLKDRLFHGMHPNIRESMRFLYKKPEVSYEEFLSETLEAEKDCSDGKTTTSAKIKSAVVTNGVPSIQKLTKEISALTTVVKSANMGGARPKTNDKSKNSTHKNGNGKLGQTSSPKKSKGPATSAAGPFKPGQKPFQCYKCGGWGHGFRECPTPGGLDWRGLSGAAPPPVEDKGPKSNNSQ